MSSQEKKPQKPQNRINQQCNKEECTLYSNFKKKKKTKNHKTKEKNCVLMKKRNCIPLGRTILPIIQILQLRGLLEFERPIYTRS